MAGGKKEEEDTEPILTTIVHRNVCPSLHEATQEALSSALHCLQIVRLDREGIRKLSDLEAVKQARSLYLQANQIKKIENLEVLKNLQFLSLSGNKIENIQNLRCLQNLQFLDLSNNLIQKLNAGELPQSLLILDMSGNPCTKIKGYREEILQALPLLQQLDGVTVRTPSNQESDCEYGEDGNDSDDTSLLSEESDGLLSLTQDMVQRSHQRRERALREHEDRLEELSESQECQSLVSSQVSCSAVLPRISQNIDSQGKASSETKNRTIKSNKDIQLASILEKNTKGLSKAGKVVLKNQTATSRTQSSTGVSTERRSDTQKRSDTRSFTTTPSSNPQTKSLQTSKQSAAIAHGRASCTLKERQTTKEVSRNTPGKTTTPSRSALSMPNQRPTRSAPNQRQTTSSKKL